nr:MAG TPA: baseplate protein [Caudoviricetes sp.]
MSLKEKINLVKQQLEINEIDTMALEKSIGKKLVDYDSIDALVAALMGYYNPLIKGISETFKNFCPFPVNSLYLSLGSENPSTLWLGTTWQKQEGRFLLGSSSSYSLGTTGGVSTIKLTVDNLPSHTHNATTASHTHTQPTHTHTEGVSGRGYSGSSANGLSHAWRETQFSNQTITTSASGGDTTGSASPVTSIGATGSGIAFSIMPPYLVVNIWKRLS